MNDCDIDNSPEAKRMFSDFSQTTLCLKYANIGLVVLKTISLPPKCGSVGVNLCTGDLKCGHDKKIKPASTHTQNIFTVKSDQEKYLGTITAINSVSYVCGFVMQPYSGSTLCKYVFQSHSGTRLSTSAL